MRKTERVCVREKILSACQRNCVICKRDIGRRKSCIRRSVSKIREREREREERRVGEWGREG